MVLQTNCYLSRSIFDDKIYERSETYYKYTHTRYSIWFIGISFGYLLYKSKDKSVEIPWYVQLVGWLATVGIIFGVVLAPFYSNGYKTHGSGKPFEGATYESFSKIGWGVMLSWVVYCCYHGYGGVVNSFLSNPLWQPFSKLSYAMYISHTVVIVTVNGNAQTETYFSSLEMVSSFDHNFMSFVKSF